jgi:hypothetical protein
VTYLILWLSYSRSRGKRFGPLWRPGDTTHNGVRLISERVSRCVLFCAGKPTGGVTQMIDRSASSICMYLVRTYIAQEWVQCYDYTAERAQNHVGFPRYLQERRIRPCHINQPTSTTNLTSTLAPDWYSRHCIGLIIRQYLGAGVLRASLQKVSGLSTVEGLR